MEDVSVLIAKAHRGDKEAREVLIENNLGLVHAIVRRFLERGVDREDLFQIGTIGLIKSIDHFDLSFGVKFSTYAVPFITGEIKRFLRDDGMIKVSRSLKEQSIKVSAARQKLQIHLGRDATLEEIAKETNLTTEEILLAVEADRRVESINAAVYQKDGSEVPLVDMLGKEDEEKEILLNRMLLMQLLEGLTQTERRLIRMRYFQDKTQTEVAKVLGISQVQVSRLEKKILLEMRRRAGEKDF